MRTSKSKKRSSKLLDWKRGMLAMAKTLEKTLEEPGRREQVETVEKFLEGYGCRPTVKEAKKKRKALGTAKYR